MLRRSVRSLGDGVVGSGGSGVPERQLGEFVYDDGIVEIVILEAVVVVVRRDMLMLRLELLRRRGSCSRRGDGSRLGGELRLDELLGLCEIDGVILELLQNVIVEVVEAIVGEVVHRYPSTTSSPRVRARVGWLAGFLRNDRGIRRVRHELLLFQTIIRSAIERSGLHS